MNDLRMKARWANEAIGPANDVLRRAGRGLVDLPTDVTPGARQVAQLTAWRAAQSYAIGPIGAALEELSKLTSWTGGFLVADKVDFDWRTAPFKHYVSFEDFYHKELEPTWGAWDKLQDTYRELVEGKIDDREAEEKVKQSQQAHAEHLAGQNGVLPIAAKSGRPKKSGNDDKIENIIIRGSTSASYRVAKLKRDHPEIAERLAAGEFKSVSAAERAAGVVHDHRLTELEKARNQVLQAWNDATDDERADFRQAMQELDSQQPNSESVSQPRMASEIKLTSIESAMLRHVAEGCNVTDNMIYTALSTARGLDQSNMGMTREGWLRHPDRPRLGELCAAGKHGRPLLERRGSGAQRTYHLTELGKEAYARLVTPS